MILLRLILAPIVLDKFDSPKAASIGSFSTGGRKILVKNLPLLVRPSVSVLVFFMGRHKEFDSSNSSTEKMEIVYKYY